ncbi:GNAT family N-acetyltransferase [Pseudenhygromyxa sp. WMMC2535]|uniref:GNAT family N-acetyltransferase n=1 Tax=Pseudenhygromyxa sp. WMMC2535 TaxID=2712867 RepID=UPI001553D562|nr:GNAT family N-acetyltransferase [Pseudenhygromyxa sp. WMMC2535]
MSEASERSWTIRDYQAGDETEIVALFERVFKKPMAERDPAAHWRWEFAQNPVGPQVIELVWAGGGRLVGQYAVSPRRLWVHGQPRLAALSLDTMTDPDYGRQGIFSSSASACYAAMVERGFDFVYGFPNANSVGGFARRLGWSVIMPAPVLIKALDLGAPLAAKLGVPVLESLLGPVSRSALEAPAALDAAAQALRTRLRGGPSLDVLPFGSFGAWADALWQRCRDQHRIWVIRDAAFLRWRYDERPESDYLRLQVVADGEVVGYAVLALSERPEGKVAFVMDLLVDLDVPGAASALLRGLETRARIQGANFMSAMAGPASPTRPWLLRHGYLPLPERLFPQELHFGGRVLAGISQAQLDDPGAWQLGWGDVDVL